MQIDTDQRNGNLHIKLNGSFDQDSAAKLTMVMMRSYQGKGNIFIHTDEISTITPDSRRTFNDLVGLSNLPKKSIYLMGEQGLAICPDSGKVLIRQKKPNSHGGCGKCKNCSCRKKAA